MTKRSEMMERVNAMVESRRKAFGPGSTGDPVLSGDGGTCTVTFYDVDRVHPGEGDHSRWSLAWIRSIHPGEESVELQVDLDGGRSRERLVGVGTGRWSEWDEEGGPDSHLGAYRTDSEIAAAAREIVASEGDPYMAPLERHLHGEVWQDDDIYLLRAAVIDTWKKTKA